MWQENYPIKQHKGVNVNNDIAISGSLLVFKQNHFIPIAKCLVKTSPTHELHIRELHPLHGFQ